ncbi:MAG: hypothetical protein ACI8S3_001213, partial [Alphaproteobacteria bacterium]
VLTPVSFLQPLVATILAFHRLSSIFIECRLGIVPVARPGLIR